MSDPQENVTYFDKAELYVRRAEKHWKRAEEIEQTGEGLKVHIETEQKRGDLYMARAVQYAAVSQAQLFETLLLYLEKRSQIPEDLKEIMRSLGMEEDGDQ